MSTILKNTLPFTGLVVGVPVAIPHLLNFNGVKKIPSHIEAKTPGYTITADNTNVTVTRGASAAAAVDVLVELWSTLEAAYPPAGITLPYILQGGTTSGGGGGGVDVEDEGVALAGNPQATLNFVGAGVTATEVAGVAVVTIPGGIAGLTVEDEGGAIAGNPHAIMNFVGAGVTATDIAGVATITIPGAAAGPIANLVITPASTPAGLAAGSTQNYAPANLGIDTVQRVAANAGNSALGGLVAKPDGTVVLLQNIGTGRLTLTHQDAGSLAANRFTCPGNVDAYVPSEGSALVIYDGTASTWVPIVINQGSQGIFDTLNLTLGNTGSLNVAGPVTINGRLALTSAITPAALALGTTNDYSPPGAAGADVIRQATDAGNSSLSGLDIGIGGQLIQILNLGPGSLTLLNRNAGSIATNRFSIGAGDLALPVGAGQAFRYDTTSGFWWMY